ncbi:MAG: marine proteobacterial sortase target protein [Sedimenticola thiotaurini]|uniref:Marine proteobacterial sortase target protein n=1 Tax=Sedimenticola thiotaurini TaxID=1543721 RepID=A0A558DBT5_9GAMM|nr:MAG: marine proteobacterial sortase target protein [Sedimenticola thiotaurini]
MENQKQINQLGRDMLFTSLASLLAGMVTALLLGLLVFIWSNSVAAAESDSHSSYQRTSVEEVKRGALLMNLASGGMAVDAPLLDTDVEMVISGMMARVVVKQQFKNPSQEWVEGTYVFPLPEDAAVDRMRLRIGERFIEGEIQEKAQAKKTYEKARREGRKASLLSQERPNIFTTAVANIAPGEMVQVEIEYQLTLHYDQGGFRLRFPLVVAPRYIPGTPIGPSEVVAFQGNGWASDTTQVPDASRITPPVVDPAEGAINPVHINIRLDAGMPLEKLESIYHPITVQQDETGIYHVSLQQGSVPAERDFELHWVPHIEAAPHAALFTEQWDNSGYALLMVMPPANQQATTNPLPREVIYVIDTSGSMHGESIIQAREALKLALQRLAPTDRFNVIQFNHQTDALFPQAVEANARNLKWATKYVNGLIADGGTEMLPALKLALRQTTEKGVLRQVVFLTDGSVGNEQALFKLIHEQLGESRLFTIGIGSAPNSFFMTRAAEFGRGTFTYIGKVEEVGEKMAALFAKLETPILTNITVQWPDGQSVEMWPSRVPDLYAGEPIVLAVKMQKPAKQLTITGQVADNAWKQQVLLKGGAVESGVHLLWARRKIAELMNEKARGRDESKVRDEVLAVALSHKLVSQYTSLVAVDKTPSRPVDDAFNSKAVPTNLPKGWSAEKVFGTLPQTATASEINLLVGMFLLILAGALKWISRSRRSMKGDFQLVAGRS